MVGFSRQLPTRSFGDELSMLREFLEWFFSLLNYSREGINKEPCCQTQLNSFNFTFLPVSWNCGDGTKAHMRGEASTNRTIHIIQRSHLMILLRWARHQVEEEKAAGRELLVPFSPASCLKFCHAQPSRSCMDHVWVRPSR